LLSRGELVLTLAFQFSLRLLQLFVQRNVFFDESGMAFSLGVEPPAQLIE